MQHQQPRGTVADPEHNHAIGATGPRGGRGVGPYGGAFFTVVGGVGGVVICGSVTFGSPGMVKPVFGVGTSGVCG